MARRTWTTPLYLAALLIGATLLPRADRGDAQARRLGLSGAAELPSLAGDWLGSWQDTIYSVGGELDMTFEVAGSQYDATGVIDLRSLGLGDEPGTLTGQANGDLLTFDFQAATVGTGSGTLNGDAGQGTGTVTAPLNFGDFTFIGTATDSQIDGTFDFTSPSGGAGVVHLTKTVSVQDRTWGAIKADRGDWRR